jgi:diguanylate cyclase (GGDEF)-like protein
MSLDALIESLDRLTNRLQRSIVSDGYFESAFSALLELAAQVGLNVSFDVKDRDGVRIASYGEHPSEVKGKVDLRYLDDRAIEAEARVQKIKRTENEAVDFEDILRKLFSAVGAHWGYRDVRSMLPGASDPSVAQRVLQSLYEQSQEAPWFAVLHGDLDKFKEINTNFGYEIGDKAIREFSDRMRAQLSATSIVVRIGGDELAAFIFSDDPNLFFDRAESLRRVMEAEPLVAIGRPNTCSIGLAMFETTDLPTDLVSITRLVSLATPQEVVAKSGGRNRISLPNRTPKPTELLDAQNALDEIRYCALVSRKDIQAEAPRSLGSPVVNAVARLLSDRFQKLQVKEAAIQAAIAKVLENINIEIVPLSIQDDEESPSKATKDGWPSPFHPQIATPLWGALLARALLSATFRGQGPLDPTDSLSFRLAASNGLAGARTTELYLDIRREDGTPISVLVGPVRYDIPTEQIVQIGRPWYPTEADLAGGVRRLVIDEAITGVAGHESLSPCLVMPIGDEAINILKTISSYVAGVVEVDDRPVKGGGLPDFWQSNLGRVVRAALRNPNIYRIVAIGEEGGAEETIKRLKLSRADWTAKSYDLQRRLSISGDSLNAFRERDIKLEIVSSDRSALLQAIATFTADEALRISAGAKPVDLDVERSKRRLLNAAPTNSNQLSLIDGLRCKSLADAYPRAIQLLRSSNEPPQVEPSQRRFREFPCFKLALTDPFQDTIPDYWESEEASIHRYFDRNFGSPDGLFGRQLATPRPGDGSARDGCIRAVVSAIQDGRPTRRTVLPVATVDQPVDQALGLSMINVMPRQRNDRWHLDFQWIWRTVEALVGFPFSAIASIRWSQEFFESVKDKLAAEGDMNRVELGQLTYVALSFHMFLDAGDLEIARAIEQDATR